MIPLPIFLVSVLPILACLINFHSLSLSCHWSCHYARSYFTIFGYWPGCQQSCMELMAHNQFHTCHQTMFHHHSATGFDRSMQPVRTYSEYSRVRQCILLYTLCFWLIVHKLQRDWHHHQSWFVCSRKEVHTRQQSGACPTPVRHDKDVLNIDGLMQCYINDHVHGSVVYLQPKGMDIFLHWREEVLEAVVCVLQALKVCQYALWPELLQVDSLFRLCMLIQNCCFTMIYIGQISFGTPAFA